MAVIISIPSIYDVCARDLYKNGLIEWRFKTRVNPSYQYDNYFTISCQPWDSKRYEFTLTIVKGSTGVTIYGTIDKKFYDSLKKNVDPDDFEMILACSILNSLVKYYPRYHDKIFKPSNGKYIEIITKDHKMVRKKGEFFDVRVEKNGEIIKYRFLPSDSSYIRIRRIEYW